VALLEPRTPPSSLGVKLPEVGAAIRATAKRHACRWGRRRVNALRRRLRFAALRLVEKPDAVCRVPEAPSGAEPAADFVGLLVVEPDWTLNTVLHELDDDARGFCSVAFPEQPEGFGCVRIENELVHTPQSLTGLRQRREGLAACGVSMGLWRDPGRDAQGGSLRHSSVPNESPICGSELDQYRERVDSVKEELGSP
jgi:hypothetical protein